MGTMDGNSLAIHKLSLHVHWHKYSLALHWFLATQLPVSCQLVTNKFYGKRQWEFMFDIH
jgi:hypothetical protein